MHSADFELNEMILISLTINYFEYVSLMECHFFNKANKIWNIVALRQIMTLSQLSSPSTAVKVTCPTGQARFRIILGIIEGWSVFCVWILIKPSTLIHRRDGIPGCGKWHQIPGNFASIRLRLEKTRLSRPRMPTLRWGELPIFRGWIVIILIQ